LGFFDDEAAANTTGFSITAVWDFVLMCGGIAPGGSVWCAILDIVGVGGAELNILGALPCRLGRLSDGNVAVDAWPA